MIHKTLITLALLASFSFAQTLKMATTTSTDNTGLLDDLAPKFEKASGIKLQWVSVGTGRALKLGENCDVSILLVHSPKVEKEFVQKGFGINRQAVAYNDFVLIGDPSYRKDFSHKNLKEIFAFIQDKQIPFISRGDKSGTHNKELAIWKMLGNKMPDGHKEWYKESGQGMLATIWIADELKGVTLTDRGTFIKYQSSLKANGQKARLVLLAEGDDMLKNFYSVITINPKRCKKTDAKGAKAFTEWITEKEGQEAIRGFKLEGKTLFTPNATPPKSPNL